ncbi:hypothetical protein D3C74_434550 [compost metagenome]
MCPALQSQGDQYAVKHTAHRCRVVHGFPQLSNDNDGQNDRCKVNGHQCVSSFQITVKQNRHEQTQRNFYHGSNSIQQGSSNGRPEHRIIKEHILEIAEANKCRSR